MGQCCGMERRVTMVEIEGGVKREDKYKESTDGQPNLEINTVKGSSMAVEEKNMRDSLDVAEQQRQIN